MQVLTAGKFFAHGFHFGEGVLVAGAVGGGDALVQALEGLVDAAEGDERLGRHLVGGNVVGVVLDAGGELGQGGLGVAADDVFHGEAVTGEGVGGIELKYLVEGG